MSLNSPPTPRHSLDLRNTRCPHLLVVVARAMATMAPGEVLRVEATDLSAPSNLTAWARQSGNQLLEMYTEGDVFVVYLQREALQSAAAAQDPTQSEG